MQLARSFIISFQSFQPLFGLALTSFVIDTTHMIVRTSNRMIIMIFERILLLLESIPAIHNPTCSSMCEINGVIHILLIYDVNINIIIANIINKIVKNNVLIILFLLLDSNMQDKALNRNFRQSLINCCILYFQ